MSFILTMWYVNTDDNVLASTGMVSFILTMWYVNAYISDECELYIGTFYINYVVCKYSKGI